MARTSAKFNVVLNSINGTKTVEVKVGTTVAQFKTENGIASSAKILDDGGALANDSILTSTEVFVSTPKKNG